GRGVYVHTPFCLVRCAYCDFNAYAGMPGLRRPYIHALIDEIRAAADGGPVGTVFFGGGTPTELPPEELGRVLEAVRDSFDLSPIAEISLEANPESAHPATFEALLQAGFNRVSVGVQSLVPHVLEALGRAHGAGRALAAVRSARSAGFENVNADLIFGTPGETRDDWRRSLEGVLESGVDHLSAYALTVEEGTPLAYRVKNGVARAPDEDDQADKYELAERLLADAGLVRYEISNWARPGYWCRHNVGYWTAGDYLGFGAGAHSHRAGRRGWNLKSPRTYIAASPHVEEGHEVLSPGMRAEEAAVLGLRLAGGLDREAFCRSFGSDPMDRWRDEIGGLEANGFLEVTPLHVRLSKRGFLFASHVARGIVGT
ncbi:MAG: radical SAM family heme chaperone HemW, partial [Actinomycetota bacterium]